MIRLRDISKTFDRGPLRVQALSGIDLDVDRGEIFGVIGHSGAGKSTLIRLLNGLERPSAGEVSVAGQRIDGASERSLRALRPRIGMIFQHFNLLWSRTVRGNIALALQIAGRPAAEIAARTEELIRLVGLDGRAEAYPSQLSGGQKQRVGIARALANAPEVLLCDEATSALDPETTEQILDLLARINRDLGLTIVLITHEMAVVRRICHRVAVMEGGRIVETGPVAEVFAAPQAEATRRMLRETGAAALALDGPLPDAGDLAQRHGVAVTLLPRPGHVLRLDGPEAAVTAATAELAARGLNPRGV